MKVLYCGKLAFTRASPWGEAGTAQAVTDEGTTLR